MGIEGLVMMITLIMGSNISKKINESDKETLTKEEINTMIAQASTETIDIIIDAKKQVEEKTKKEEDVKKAMEVIEKIHTGKIQ